MQPMPQSSRQIFGWCLFDFSASALMANGGLYFPSWVVIDIRVPDFWFNATVALSTIAVLLGAPTVGALADRLNRPRLLLTVASAAMVLSTLALVFVQRMAAGIERQIIALALLLVVLTTFQFAMMLYNGIFARAFHNDARRKISGLGIFSSWLGAVFGLVAVLPFVHGMVPGIEPGRASAFVPAAMLFFFLGAFALRCMPSGTLSILSEEVPIKLKSVYKVVRSSRTLFWFLCAYILIMDAVLTIQNNIPIFLTRVFSTSDDSQAYLFLTLFIGAAGGGLASILLLKRYTPIAVLKPVAVSWFAVILAIGFTQISALNFLWFSVAGLLLGVTLSASRVQFAALVPRSSATTFFGIYNAFERLASILGPLTWGAIIALTVGHPIDLRYRLAFLTMALFVLAAFFSLRRTTVR